MPWTDEDAVLEWFQNHLQRLPAWIEAHAGPEAVGRMDAAILAELRAPGPRANALEFAARILTVAGEHELADQVRTRNTEPPDIRN